MTTIIVCPICHKNNTWEHSEYKQGSIFKCASCLVRLQQIFCPHCSSSTIWSNPRISAEGRTINCAACSKSFLFLCCSRCHEVNMFKGANYEQNFAYNCAGCTRTFLHVSCAYCSESNVYRTAATIQGARLVCRSCTKVHQYIQCPHCQKGHVWKDCDYIAGSVVSCGSCKQRFAHMACPRCQKSNFWKNPSSTTLRYVWFECQSDMCTAMSHPKPRTGKKSAVKHDKVLPSSASSDHIHKGPDRMRGRSASMDLVGDDKAARPSSRAESSHSRRGIDCTYFTECEEFVKQLAWRIQFFNMKHDRCYCQMCYPDHLSDTLRVAEADYVVPRGWAGFGLGVDPFRGDDIWNTWIVVYHGTTTIAAESILAHRQFLLPGDHLINGLELPIRPGHIPGKIHIYTSPSIRYASLDVYSTVYSFKSPTTSRRYNAQIVLQCKQKLGTFNIQRETVGWGTKRICDIIPNERIEYYTNRRSTVVPYRLLIRLTDA